MISSRILIACKFITYVTCIAGAIYIGLIDMEYWDRDPVVRILGLLMLALQGAALAALIWEKPILRLWALSFACLGMSLAYRCNAYHLIFSGDFWGAI